MTWRELLSQLEGELLVSEEIHLAAVLSNLATAPELAARYGYASANTFKTYAARHTTFPEPVKRFGRIDVWWVPDVEKWMGQPKGRHISS